MRVLLTTLNAKYIHTNLAIRILYELNQKHPGLEWKEFTIRQDPAEIAGFCAQFDIIAFSCYIWNISPTLEVARRVKQMNPSIRVLLGGPEVTYDYNDIITRPEVDYIIAGEGEIAFSEFLRHSQEPELVPGLVWKKETGICENPQPPVFDVKHFADAMPYRFDDTATLMNKVLYIETSRGCPYKCGFCLASLDNKVRYLPDTQIRATLLHLMQHGKVIKFLDRTFNMKRDFTIGIFQFILDNHRPGNIFQFEITADILHPDIIAFIHEKVPPGLFRFEIGIQTVNQKANLAVGRKQNFDKTKSIIQALSGKIEMHLDLIVGLALDKWDDIRHSFEQVFSLYAPELQLGFLKFLKGTPVRDTYTEHGFVFDPEPPYQIISSNYLSAEELYRLALLEHALEIYWNGGKARHTLRYASTTYGSFDFLLGLGEHFKNRADLHKFSLDDTFNILREYAQTAHPGDKVLTELIAIDYYLHFKVRPRRFCVELEIDNTMQKGKHGIKKDRHVGVPLSFCFETFRKDGHIVTRTDKVIIAYNGTSKAHIVENSGILLTA